MKSTKQKAREASEAQEQRALFEWAAWASARYPALKTLFHIPNGGSRNPVEALHLKDQGVKPGVPDICLPVHNKIYHALYIELKRRKGGRISDAQRQWIADLNGYGNRAVVCNGWEEARDVILDYLRH